MKNLNLSQDVSFPADIVTKKTVVYGLNGMGKSNLTLGKLPEELHRLGLRFYIMDLMGVAWGLQHGAKKGEQGIDVLILGGPHGDVEIEPTAGAVVADLVADEEVSTVIDMSRQKNGKGWSKSEKIRFTADFYLRLYERQAETRRPLLIIQDEAARVIPQTIPYGSPDLARCVGAIETMAEEGRALGVGMIFVTPRSARLNKSVAELSDTMIAFRTFGPNSMTAVMDWLGQHVEKDRHKEIVGKLRSLPVGSALVVSPGWLEHEGIARFHMRSTFDSTATPKPGVVARAPGAASKPDLAKYRDRMKATIEKAKAEDPKALRQKVAELERSLREAVVVMGAKRVPLPAAAPKIVEVPVLTDAQVTRLESALEKARKVQEIALEALLTVSKQVTNAVSLRKAAVPPPAAKLAPGFLVIKEDPSMPRGRVELRHPHSGAVQARIENVGTGAPMPPRQRRILDALAYLESIGRKVATKGQVAIYADASPNSGRFDMDLAYLKKAGLVAAGTVGFLRITDAGRAQADPVMAPQSEAELHERIMAKIPPRQQRILRAAIEHYPNTIGREAIAEASGASVGSGRFDMDLSFLKGIGVIEYPSKGVVRASDIMFAKGA